MIHVVHWSGADVALGGLVFLGALAAIGARLAGVLGAIAGFLLGCWALSD